MITRERYFLAVLMSVTGAATVACAQTKSLDDPAQLPESKGTVQAYSLTPRGDVDGLILSDGTEVHCPPPMSIQLVFAVKPGDAVTVHGLKARSVPLVAAASITNDSSGRTVVGDGGADADRMQVQGRVKAALHGPRGEINGALLEDGTILRLPPPEANRLASQLAPGQAVTAEGPGLATDLGRVIEVRRIGGSPNRMTEVAYPKGPEDGPKGPKGGPRDRGASDIPPPPRG
jgi:hypothetical protein